MEHCACDNERLNITIECKSGGERGSECIFRLAAQHLQENRGKLVAGRARSANYRHLWPRQSGHELLCRKSFETELWQGHSVGFGSRTWPAPHPSVLKPSKAPSEIFMRVATIMPSPEQRGQMPRVMQMQHKSCKFKGNTALFLLSTTFALGKILYSSICYLFKTAVSTNPWLKLLE